MTSLADTISVSKKLTSLSRITEINDSDILYMVTNGTTSGYVRISDIVSSIIEKIVIGSLLTIESVQDLTTTLSDMLSVITSNSDTIVEVSNTLDTQISAHSDLSAYVVNLSDELVISNATVALLEEEVNTINVRYYQDKLNRLENLLNVVTIKSTVHTF